MARKAKTTDVKPAPRKRAARPQRPPTRVRVVKMEGDDLATFANLFAEVFPGFPPGFPAGSPTAVSPVGGASVIDPGPVNPPVPEQGSVQRVLNTVSMCHNFVTSMEQVANRVLGAERETNAHLAPVAEGEINAVADMTQALLERLAALRIRLLLLSPGE